MKQRGRTFFMSGICAIVLMIAVAALLKIYPFGDHTILYGDADQYLAFIAQEQRILLSSGSFRYTWNQVLGGNYIGTYGFYCASPVNLLCVFFQDNLILFYHLTIAVKLVLASVSFCYMLEKIHPSDSFTEIIFSLLYAWSGYVSAYFWNTSWLDAVCILPVLFLSIRELIDKEKTLPYIFLLFFALISNFYTGYMLCGFSLLCFAGLLVKRKNRSSKIILRYIVSSVLAAMCSAFLLLPVFLSLPSERKISLFETLRQMHGNYHFFRQFRMYLTGAYSMNDMANNLPIVFVGIVPLVLVFQFFCNHKISAKKRMITFLCLAVFLISFHNSFFNLVWHGLSQPNWFNYRYSFLVIFLLLCIAYQSFQANVQPKDVLISACAAAVFFLIVFWASRQKIRFLFYAADIALAAAALWLLYKQPKYSKKVLLCLALANVLCNHILSIQKGIQSVSAKALQETIQETKELLPEENLLYRAESELQGSRANAALMGYHGITNYASTENREILEFVQSLGIQQTWMWASYNDSVPYSVRSFLGIKHVIREKYNSEFIMWQMKQTENAALYQFDEALPVFFTSSKQNDKVSAKWIYERMNAYWHLLVPERIQDIAYLPDCKITSSEGKTTLSFIAENEDPVYLETTGNLKELHLFVNQTEYETKITTYQMVHKLGQFQKGDQIEAEIIAEDNAEIRVFQENLSALQEYAAIIKEKNKDLTVEMIADGKLSIFVNMDEDGFLTSTVPYDENWKCTIDGKEAECTKDFGLFLSIGLTKGRHTVIFEFIPKGFIVGRWISGVGIVFVAMSASIDKRKRKKDKDD